MTIILCSKFKEFEARQTEILEKITDVERTFRESQIRLGLLQGGVNIITSELKFNPGKKNCWVTGIFTDREIKSGYDARRPITEEIIDSIEKNHGTIIYGEPYTEKVFF